MENDQFDAASTIVDLSLIRSDLKKQIRSNSKVAILQEQLALRSKKSVVKLKRKKAEMEKIIQDLSAEPIAWSSSDDVDSDLISSESDIDFQDEQVKMCGCFRGMGKLQDCKLIYIHFIELCDSCQVVDNVRHLVSPKNEFIESETEYGNFALMSGEN